MKEMKIIQTLGGFSSWCSIFASKSWLCLCDKSATHTKQICLNRFMIKARLKINEYIIFFNTCTWNTEKSRLANIKFRLINLNVI